MHFTLTSTSLNQKFKTEFSGTYMFDNNQLPGVDITQYAVALEPNAPSFLNADGSINWMLNTLGSSIFGENPYALLAKKYQNKTSNLTSNAVFSYHLLPGLELRSSFGYNNIRADELQTNPLVSIRPEWRILS